MENVTMNIWDIIRGSSNFLSVMFIYSIIMILIGIKIPLLKIKNKNLNLKQGNNIWLNVYVSFLMPILSILGVVLEIYIIQNIQITWSIILMITLLIDMTLVIFIIVTTLCLRNMKMLGYKLNNIFLIIILFRIVYSLTSFDIIYGILITVVLTVSVILNIKYFKSRKELFNN